MTERTELDATPSGPRTRGLRAARRVELFGLAAAVGLAVVGGVAWTLGLTDPPPAAPLELALRGGGFRPFVADLVGGVEYRPAGRSEWRALRWSDAFSEGDRLRTGPGATCDVLLTWRTGVRLMPSTELSWRRLEAAGAAREVVIELRRGQVLSSLDALPEGSHFEILTPRCRARVRGTVLSVSADEGGAGVSVLSGVVEVVDTSDPTRRVEVGSDTAIGFGPGADGGRIRPLSAEERLELLQGITAVDRVVGRLSPPRPGPAAEEGDVLPLAPVVSAAAGAVEAPGSTAADPGRRAPEEARVRDVEEVTTLLQQGLLLLDADRVPEALALCTPDFRAVIEGTLSSASNSPVATEVRRQDALEARDRLAAVLRLRMAPTAFDVLIDGDVAYATVLVTVTATLAHGETERPTVRRYACTARCLRVNGRWAVDLATASEGG